MSTEYLLDTNIVSYALKGGYPKLDERLTARDGGLAISVITEAELRYGIGLLPNSARAHQLVTEFLVHALVLPWDSPAAIAYSELRVALRKSGQILDNLDLMIAAHALSTGRVLVTNDTAFSRIPNLRVEDWTI